MKKPNMIIWYGVAIFLWAIAYVLIAKAVGISSIINDYFVGWGTLALINAGLAQGKRMSGFQWFLLSLLFGPVCTFLIVILDANGQDIQDNEEDE